MDGRGLNLDIAGTVSEFEKDMKEFMIKKILYKIIFRGKGLEFDSYRDYAPDDDARDIDWMASKRANRTLVKQYIEERDLKIMFVVDVSENMIFGSTEKLKCEYAAEVCAALSHLIMVNGDKIGFVFFNSGITKVVFPEAGKKQFNIFVDELSDPLAYGGISDLKSALNFLLDYLDVSISVVILVSDFISVRKDVAQTLDFLAKKFETMAIMIKDPLDKTLPDIRGEFVVEDSSSGQQLVIDPGVARRTYEKNALEQEKMVMEIFENSGADMLKLMTNEGFSSLLAEFLKERLEKGRYVMPKK